MEKSQIQVFAFYEALGKFLLPEKELSLKLAFDNLRNYLVCGAYFLFIGWLRPFALGDLSVAPSFVKPIDVAGEPGIVAMIAVARWCIIIAASLLTLLNVLQSLLMVVRLTAHSSEQALDPTSEWPFWLRFLIHIGLWCVVVPALVVFLMIGIPLLMTSLSSGSR